MRELLLSIVLLLSCSLIAEPATDALFPRTDPKTVGLVYQMLQAIDEIFTIHDIPYWIDGGTVLGAVRHGGMIPWDDDADLVFFIEDKARIQALKDEFAKYGFSLRTEEIFRLYPSDTITYPFIDIAGYRLCMDATLRFDDVVARAYFKDYYWYLHEVLPLVRVPFGPLMLNAPNEMMRYLIKGYGKDCLTHATFHNHTFVENAPTQKVKIINFAPAEYIIGD